MGVPYETGPQSNLAWLTEKFAAIDRRFEEAERGVRLGGRTGGQVTGSLLVVSPHSNEQTPTLVRIGGVVYVNFRVRLGGAIGADGIVATLPAGFRPAGTTHALWTGTKNSGGTWGTQTYWCNPADGGIRLLGSGLASGDLAASLVPPFPAGS